MIGLTQQQHDCLAFIRAYTAERGASPSYEDIRAALCLASKANVFRLIESLEERGRIQRLPGQSRSLSVVDGPSATPNGPADLCGLESDELRRLATHIAGTLADRHGCAEAERVFRVIATGIGSLPVGGVQ